MASPDVILRSIKDAIKESGRLPKSTTYATFELDPEGGQADVYPPVVEITPTNMARSTSMNTDLIGYSKDGSGNHIGQIYRAVFQMEIQISVMTAESDVYNPVEMRRSIQKALYEYENRQFDRLFPDPDASGTLGDITMFEMVSGEPNNDFTMSPTLRGSILGATVWFRDTIDTAAEYGKQEFVKTVHLPEDGDASGDGITITFDSTPSYTSPADNY